MARHRGHSPIINGLTERERRKNHCMAGERGGQRGDQLQTARTGYSRGSAIGADRPMFGKWENTLVGEDACVVPPPLGFKRLALANRTGKAKDWVRYSTKLGETNTMPHGRLSVLPAISIRATISGFVGRKRSATGWAATSWRVDL